MVFLGIDIFLYLRGHIQNHNSVTSFVNSCNSMFECNVNYQKVLDGYLLFDLLCQSDKEFYCDICGHHPWILVMDLNRKIAFKMSANEINGDNENDAAIDLDEVNIWERVELNIISIAFSRVTLKSLSLKPNLYF